MRASCESSRMGTTGARSKAAMGVLPHHGPFKGNIGATLSSLPDERKRTRSVPMLSVPQVKDRSSAREGRALRAAVAIAVGLAAAIIAFTIAAGVTGSLVAALPIPALASAVVAARLWERPIVSYDPAATSRPLRIVSAVATVAALIQLARLAVFMMSP